MSVPFFFDWDGELCLQPWFVQSLCTRIETAQQRKGWGTGCKRPKELRRKLSRSKAVWSLGMNLRGHCTAIFTFFSPSPFTTCIECNVYSGFNCNCLIEICHNLLCYICSSTYFYLQPSDLFSVDNVRTSRWFLNSAKKGIYPVPQPQAGFRDNIKPKQGREPVSARRVSRAISCSFCMWSGDNSVTVAGTSGA